MTSVQQQQTWREAAHGSRADYLEVTGPLSALAVDQTQGRAHVRFVGIAVNPKASAAAAIIPIARGVPAAERGRRVSGAARCSGGRRSAAVAPWLQQIATNSRRKAA